MEQINPESEGLLTSRLFGKSSESQEYKSTDLHKALLIGETEPEEIFCGQGAIDYVRNGGKRANRSQRKATASSTGASEQELTASQPVVLSLI